MNSNRRLYPSLADELDSFLAAFGESFFHGGRTPNESLVGDHGANLKHVSVSFERQLHRNFSRWVKYLQFGLEGRRIRLIVITLQLDISISTGTVFNAS